MVPRGGLIKIRAILPSFSYVKMEKLLRYSSDLGYRKPKVKERNSDSILVKVQAELQVPFVGISKELSRSGGAMAAKVFRG
jgi:hypothetical protein